VADEPSPDHAGEKDVPSDAPPGTDAPPGGDADKALAWSSMDLPGMDPADGNE
jgi:hypothetical protein